MLVSLINWRMIQDVQCVSEWLEPGTFTQDKQLCTLSSLKVFEELNCKTAYVHIDMFLILFCLKSNEKTWFYNSIVFLLYLTVEISIQTFFNYIKLREETKQQTIILPKYLLSSTVLSSEDMLMLSTEDSII